MQVASISEAECFVCPVSQRSCLRREWFSRGITESLKQDGDVLDEDDKQEVIRWKLWTDWLLSILSETMEKLDMRCSDKKVYI